MKVATVIGVMKLILSSAVLIFVVQGNKAVGKVVDLQDQRDSLFLRAKRLEYIIQNFSENNPDYDLVEVSIESRKLKLIEDE